MNIGFKVQVNNHVEDLGRGTDSRSRPLHGLHEEISLIISSNLTVLKVTADFLLQGHQIPYVPAFERANLGSNSVSVGE